VPAVGHDTRIGIATTMMMPYRDDPEVLAFLNAQRTAVLATIRRDGSAQLSPVWFLWKEDRFIFSAGRQTAKTANLRRDPRVSLCIFADQPVARYLFASGTAALVAESARRELAFTSIAKYLPAEEIEDYWDDLERNEPQVLYIFQPERVVWREFPPLPAGLP
jgi:PPOX class probable F420-dependent enzyme